MTSNFRPVVIFFAAFLLAVSLLPFFASHFHSSARYLPKPATQIDLHEKVKQLPMHVHEIKKPQSTSKEIDVNKRTKRIGVKAKQNPVVSDTTNFDKSAKEQIFHFVVSSDCSPFQRWQVLTQMHSAISVGQAGKYTWIVSGCPDEEEEEKANEKRQLKRKHTKSKAHGQDNAVLSRSSLLADIQRNFPSLCNPSIISALECPSLHFSPDFSDMTKYGGPYADGKTKRKYVNKDGKVHYSEYGNTYRFNNKPNGLRHWSEAGESYNHAHNRNPSSFDAQANEAIVLIDPDFLFLRPFELPKDVTLSPGKPAGANYGLGDQWLGFNLTAICGPTSQCVNTTSKEVYKYYSAGPPYIIHAHDVQKFSIRWSQLVPPTYDQYPLLYAEMYAYSEAAADLELRHTLVRDLFTGCMVHWPRGEIKPLEESAQRFIDAFDNSTEEILRADEGVKSCFGGGLEPPPLLHYCKRYPFRLNNGEWKVLAKRRVNHDVLDCHHDEKLIPWDDEGKEISPKGFKRNREENWNALGVCAVIRGVAYAKKISCRRSQ